MRSCVERGNIPYSAVTQPCPLPLSQGGTLSSSEAVTSTCVSPNLVRHEPSAYLTTCASRLIWRSSKSARFEGRMQNSKEGAGLTCVSPYVKAGAENMLPTRADSLFVEFRPTKVIKNHDRSIVAAKPVAA